MGEPLAYCDFGDGHVAGAVGRRHVLPDTQYVRYLGGVRGSQQGDGALRETLVPWTRLILGELWDWVSKGHSIKPENEPSGSLDWYLQILRYP